MFSKHSPAPLSKLRFMVGLCALPLCVTASASRAQPSFQGLGDLPGGAQYSSAAAVSPDGGTVVGLSEGENGTFAFRWSQSTGMVPLPALDAQTPYAAAQGVARHGIAISGHSNSSAGAEAFRWTPGGGTVPLGRLPGNRVQCYGNGITPNGLTVVGEGWADGVYVPWCWTLKTGYAQLATTGHGAAIDVSDDGGVIVGTHGSTHENRQGFVWTQASGLVSIGTLPGEVVVSQLHAVTASGHAAVGSGSVNGNSLVAQAIFWSKERGIVPLGTLPGHTVGAARDVTADASVVVGGTGINEDASEAFIWDELNGMRSLQSILENEYHLDLKGWRLRHAFAITPDGTTIVGVGVNPLNHEEAWIARLPRTPCPADFNADGEVTSQDFFDFLTAFFTGCP